MKRSSLVLLLLVIVTAAGTALYQARLLATEREFTLAEQKRTLQLERQLAELRRQRAATAPAAPAEVVADPAANPSREADGAPASASSAHQAEVSQWLARLKRLRQSFTDHPDQSIPELSLLSDLEWLTLTRDLGSLETEADLRQARAALRNAASAQFMRLMRDALRDFAAATNGQLPADFAQLQPYLKTALDPAVFQRYEIRAIGTARSQRGQEAIAQRAPIDDEFDVRYAVTADQGTRSGPWAVNFLRVAQEDATAAYAAANNGARPRTPAELLPFMRDPIARTINQAIVDHESSHHGQQPNDVAELRPLIRDPAARVQLEKIIRSQQSMRR